MNLVFFPKTIGRGQKMVKTKVFRKNAKWLHSESKGRIINLSITLNKNKIYFFGAI